MLGSWIAGESVLSVPSGLLDVRRWSGQTEWNQPHSDLSNDFLMASHFIINKFMWLRSETVSTASDLKRHKTANSCMSGLRGPWEVGLVIWTPATSSTHLLALTLQNAWASLSQHDRRDSGLCRDATFVARCHIHTNRIPMAKHAQNARF